MARYTRGETPTESIHRHMARYTRGERPTGSIQRHMARYTCGETPKRDLYDTEGQLHLWGRPQADFTPQTNPEDQHTLP